MTASSSEGEEIVIANVVFTSPVTSPNTVVRRSITMSPNGKNPHKQNKNRDVMIQTNAQEGEYDETEGTTDFEDTSSNSSTDVLVTSRSIAAAISGDNDLGGPAEESTRAGSLSPAAPLADTMRSSLSPPPRHSSTPTTKTEQKRIDRKKWGDQLDRFNKTFREKRLVARRRASALAAESEQAAPSALHANTPTTTSSSTNHQDDRHHHHLRLDLDNARGKVQEEQELRLQLQEQLATLQGHYQALLLAQQKEMQQQQARVYEHARKEAQLRALQQACEALRLENVQLVEQRQVMNQLQAQLNELIVQQEQVYQDHLMETQRNLQQSQAAYQSAQDQLVTLQIQVQALQVALQQSQQQQDDSSSTTIQELNRQVKSLMSETNELRAEQLATEADRHQTMDQLKQQLRESKQALEEKELQLLQEAEETSRLASQVSLLQEETKQLREQVLTLQNKAPKDTIQELQAQIQRLENQCQNQRKLIQNLERQSTAFTYQAALTTEQASTVVRVGGNPSRRLSSLSTLMMSQTLDEDDEMDDSITGGGGSTNGTNSTYGRDDEEDDGDESLQSMFQSWKSNYSNTNEKARRHTVSSTALMSQQDGDHSSNRRSSSGHLQMHLMHEAMKTNASNKKGTAPEQSSSAPSFSTTPAELQRSFIEDAMTEKRRQSGALARIASMFLAPQPSDDESEVRLTILSGGHKQPTARASVGGSKPVNGNGRPGLVPSALDLAGEITAITTPTGDLDVISPQSASEAETIASLSLSGRVAEEDEVDHKDSVLTFSLAEA